mmetsp:Transcript_29449/g.93876  ORF Transcript_29449/g.93876 Transcript_29449/m.93876 type:complete len:218 (+) Transcript_29449:569-1222(+)
MCTRSWWLRPVRARNCTSVNQRSRPQNCVPPRAGTHHCLRARNLVTAGKPSLAQASSRRVGSWRLAMGASTTPRPPAKRPSTSARYSRCTRCAALWATKWLKASPDLAKICTPLVWPSSLLQIPRCRGSSRQGMSTRWCAMCAKFVGDVSHRPLGLKATNMPAGFATATKCSDSARASTSHHWSTVGAPRASSSVGVSGTSKQRHSGSPWPQKVLSS